MIIVASQRGGAENLAAHLLNGHNNEQVEIHAINGFMGDNVPDALAEIEALSKGTRCTQYMFSVSFSPPPDVKATTKTFERAIQKTAKANGLQNQPHVIVFHEKQGRRHAHAVWSRIDVQRMRAINLPHFKDKLMRIGKSIYLEQGWRLPDGHTDKTQSNPLNYTLAEWQQAKRQKRDPKEIKALLQECWQTTRTKAQFEKRLEKHGYFLACGNPRRAFVVVDWQGEIRSLSRQVKQNKKDLQARLGDPDKLPSIDKVKVSINQKLADNLNRNLVLQQKALDQKLAPLRRKKQTMTRQHKAQRETLLKQQESRRLAEAQQRQQRYAQGWRGLWHRVTGQHLRITKHNEREALQAYQRDQLERDNLIFKQLSERRDLQTSIELQHQTHKQQNQTMHQNISAVFKRSKTQKRDMELSL